MLRTTILVAILTLAGCASAGNPGLGDCGGADWYKYGLRDGSVSGRSSFDEYSAQCAAFGVKPDAARYTKGLEDGQWEKAHQRF